MAYRRNFEGYSEIKRKDSNGRTHIDRVYTYHFFLSARSDPSDRSVRILFPSLAMLSAAALIFCSAMQIESNVMLYVVITQIACIVFLFLEIVSAFKYAFRKKQMTINEYKTTSVSFIRWSLCSAISFAVSSVAALTYPVFFTTVTGSLIFLYSMIMLVFAAIQFALHLTEKKTPYYNESNPEQAPPGTIEIDL